MIGDRIKEERERLGLSQPKFGELAGAAKRTVIDWEKGVSGPTAFQLAAIASAGADVLYIVTGDRDGPAPEVLTADERVLLDGYRALDPATRRRMLAFVLGGEATTSRVQRITTNHGQITQGGKIINKGQGNK